MVDRLQGEVARADLTARAIELRAKKHNWRDIAAELGCSAATARKWVLTALRESIPLDDLDSIRVEELQTLDTLERNALNMLETGNEELQLKAQDHILRVQTRRSKLLGLDAPQKVLHGVQIRREYDEELEILVQTLVGGGQLMSDPEELVIDGEAEG